MRILCDKPASEADKEVRQEEVRGQACTSRPQRTRNMFARLQECVIKSDNMVDDEEELSHYAFYANIESVNVIKELKDSKWMQMVNEELKSIEVNNTWSLVKLP